MAHLEGKIVLRDRIVSGRLNFDSHIREIVSQSVVPERYILPGFIDVHVHGGGGADTIDGVAAIETLSRFHLGHGTTTILPTTITAPWAEVMDALRSVAEVCDRGVEGSPHKLGAQPPFNIEPTAELVAEAVATGGGACRDHRAEA